MAYLCAALAAVNLAAFIIMGIDKRRAVRNRWRIPERVLILFCVPFSAAGGLIGMHVFRHKTRKIKFSLGVPALLIAQIVLGVLLLRLF